MEQEDLESLKTEFATLLAPTKHSSRHEQLVQEFLERHPRFLPGLWDLHGGPAGDGVLTKPDLGDFIPDFAFVSQTTASYQFTLVEIEDPCNFDDLSQRLVDAGFQVILPQPRGIGGSTDPMGSITYHDLAADVAATIKAVVKTLH